MTPKRQQTLHLEGSLIVELIDGRKRHLDFAPFDGKVIHSTPGEAFGQREITAEGEFRRQLKRIVSRSRYDRR